MKRKSKVKHNNTVASSNILNNICIIEHATGDAFRLQLHCIRDLTIPSGKNITKYKESVSG